MSIKIPLSESTIAIDLKTAFSSVSSAFVEEFEESLEQFYHKEKSIVALNSGTSAIHLALILSGVKEGDEVLCQSLTYVATVNPIRYQKATPVFIDSEKDTWNMCPVQLECAIKDRILKGKKPKAIIFVNLYGMPAKIDEIVSIAKKYHIILIEDAAEALGAEYKGQKCGTFGDFGILSFNNNKIISTLGGGALICKTAQDKQKAIFYATQAKENEIHYEHKEVGYNYRMNSFGAIIGINQLKMLQEYLKRKIEINNFYRDFFINFTNVTILKNYSVDYFSNHWLSCILIEELEGSFGKQKLMLWLKKNNIESRLIWKPMHLQPVFKDYPYYGAKIAENIFKKGLCLPSGTNINKEGLQRITFLINKLM